MSCCGTPRATGSNTQLVLAQYHRFHRQSRQLYTRAQMLMMMQCSPQGGCIASSNGGQTQVQVLEGWLVHLPLIGSILHIHPRKFDLHVCYFGFSGFPAPPCYFFCATFVPTCSFPSKPFNLKNSKTRCRPCSRFDNAELCQG